MLKLITANISIARDTARNVDFNHLNTASKTNWQTKRLHIREAFVSPKHTFRLVNVLSNEAESNDLNKVDLRSQSFFFKSSKILLLNKKNYVQKTSGREVKI